MKNENEFDTDAAAGAAASAAAPGFTTVFMVVSRDVKLRLYLLADVTRFLWRYMAHFWS